MLLFLLCVINFIQLCLKIRSEYRVFVREICREERIQMNQRRQQQLINARNNNVGNNEHEF